MITKAIVFDHRGRTKAGAEGPVELRVTVNRKPYYINTGIKVRGRELRDGHIVGRADKEVLQDQLDIITDKVMRAVNRCVEKGIAIDVAEIRRQAYEMDAVGAAEKTAMIDWLTEQVPLLNIAVGTRNRYKTMVKRLGEYGRMAAWRDLTVENIYLWDGWLHSLKVPQSNADMQAGKPAEGICEAAVYNYHRTLRAMLSRAVKMGKIDANPYDKLRGEFRKGIKENVEYLTDAEIAAFESLHPMQGTQAAAARDLFVFQMYTGLSYSDAQAFDISDYKEIVGKWIHTGTRIKTGVPYVNQLLPPVIEILQRYGWQAPKILNSDYNKCLKILAAAVGIETRLHSHLARHTFATRMLRMGVKIENLSKMLGHTNINQTQKYAKVMAQSVHDDFEMVAKKLERKTKPKL